MADISVRQSGFPKTEPTKAYSPTLPRTSWYSRTRLDAFYGAAFSRKVVTSLQRLSSLKLPHGSDGLTTSRDRDQSKLPRLQRCLSLKSCESGEFSDLSFEEKHPIILPRDQVTTLLVRFQRAILKHAGVTTLLSSLRTSYWIIGLRRLAKSVVSSCVFCRKVSARACSQPAAPLPEFRVSKAPPFTVTGVDFAGPLFCVDQAGRKLYVCLFTCAVVRAVHLELTGSLFVKTSCWLSEGL